VRSDRADRHPTPRRSFRVTTRLVEGERERELPTQAYLGQVFKRTYGIMSSTFSPGSVAGSPRALSPVSYSNCHATSTRTAKDQREVPFLQSAARAQTSHAILAAPERHHGPYRLGLIDATIYCKISLASIFTDTTEWHASCPTWFVHLWVVVSEGSVAVRGNLATGRRVPGAVIPVSINCKSSHLLRFGSSLPHTARKEICCERG